jgi:hypothetical protein
MKASRFKGMGRWLRSTPVVGVIALAFVLTACGDDSMNQPPPTPEHIKKLALQRKKVVAKPKPRKNKRWESIKGHFLGQKAKEGQPETAKIGYVKRISRSMRDPFEPQLVKFVQRVRLVSDSSGNQTDETPAGIQGPDLRPIPLAKVNRDDRLLPIKYPAASYQLRMILWGSSVDKARIQDPDGRYFTVKKDDNLGNNGGVVATITKWTVEVVEPDSTEPIPLSIEPGLLRVHNSAGNRPSVH